MVLIDERCFFWQILGFTNLEFLAALQGMRPRVARGATTETLAAGGLAAVAVNGSIATLPACVPTSESLALS